MPQGGRSRGGEGLGVWGSVPVYSMEATQCAIFDQRLSRNPAQACRANITALLGLSCSVAKRSRKNGF